MVARQPISHPHLAVPPEPAEQVCVAVAVDNYGLYLRGELEKFGFEDVEHISLRLLMVSCAWGLSCACRGLP